MTQRHSVSGRRSAFIWLSVLIGLMLVAALAVIVLFVYPNYQRRQQVERHYQAGVAFREIEDWDKAVEAFEKVVAIDANYNDAQTRLAEVRAKRQETQATAQAKAARETATAQARAEAIAATATAEAGIAQATSAAATATAQAKATVEAQQAKATATAETVTQLEAAYQKCLGAINLERWAEAKTACDQVFAVDPNYKEVQAKLREVETKLAEVRARTPSPVPNTLTPTPKPTPSHIYTDESWLTSHQSSNGWERLDFDDSAWISSSIVAYEGWNQLRGMDPRAKWIWNPDAGQNVPIFFRKKLTLKALPTSAVLRISGDNAYTVFVNGNFIGEDDVWEEAENYTITPFLISGSNVIAVQVIDLGGAGGLIASLTIAY